MRERLVCLRVETVAHVTGIKLGRLRAIEDGADPTVLELERLAEIYGVDVETLWEMPISLSPGDGVTVLTSVEEFRDVDDVTRVRILRAATAARDLVTLRRRSGDPLPPLPTLPTPNPQDSPYRQGASLAVALRMHLGLGVHPIASLRDLVAERLPGVAVIGCDLGARGPAGLGFADTHRGPAVVLNTRGKNENPAVRRFSLAHELCHLLSDWDRAEPLVSISGYLTDQGLDRERRANGFAARFLCPETVVHRLRHVRDEDAARVLIDEYGMHYGAARLYLRNEANVHLPEQPPTALRPFIEPDAGMSQREAMRGVEGFPLAEVPMERRGVVGETVMRAWSRGLIPRDAAARFLGVTPVAEIERVADFFDTDIPEAAVAS